MDADTARLAADLLKAHEQCLHTSGGPLFDAARAEFDRLLSLVERLQGENAELKRRLDAELPSAADVLGILNTSAVQSVPVTAITALRKASGDAEHFLVHVEWNDRSSEESAGDLAQAIRDADSELDRLLAAVHHRQGCECGCCDHGEGSDCACDCHATGKCSSLAAVPQEAAPPPQEETNGTTTDRR